MAITLKTKEELALMREAGRIVAITLARLAEAAKPGVTTADLGTFTYRHRRVPLFPLERDTQWP